MLDVQAAPSTSRPLHSHLTLTSFLLQRPPGPVDGLPAHPCPPTTHHLIANIVIPCSPLLPPGYGFMKHKSNYIIGQLQILHFLPPPRMQGRLPIWPMRFSGIQPHLSLPTVLLLLSLRPLGMATIYLYVKIQPRLHHLGPARPLYPYSSTIRPAS